MQTTYSGTRSSLATALLATWLLSYGAAQAVTVEAPAVPDSAVREAFEYAYPLVAMGRLRGSMLGTSLKPGPSKLNTWLHQRRLSTYRDRWVTTPNNDTLYSTLWLDLRQGPVSLGIPDMDGRYYSLAFMDMATNNFEILGRRASGTRETSVVVDRPRGAQSMERRGCHHQDAATFDGHAIGKGWLAGKQQDLPKPHACRRNAQYRGFASFAAVDDLEAALLHTENAA